MRDFWRRHHGGLVLLLGCGAVAVGAGMVYPPAGVIAGGVLAIAWWILDSLSGGDDV